MSGRIRFSRMANQMAGGVWLNGSTGRHQGGRSLRTMAADVFGTSISWLVYAIFLPIAVLNGRAAQRLLLAILIIDIPLQLGSHLDFQKDAAAVGSLGGFDVSLTTIALVGLYFSWWTSCLVRADHRLQPPARLSLWPILYVLVTALSMVVARDITLSLFELFLLLQMLLLYVYISKNVTSRQDVIFIVTVLMLGLVLESLLMISIVSVGLGFRIGGYASHIDPGTTLGRVAGTLGSANVAGGYLSVVLAPAISVLLTDLKRWYKGMAMVAFGLGVVSLILTGSRGGWLACAVAMTTVYVFGSRGKRMWLAVAIAGNFVLMVAFLFQDVIVTRTSASAASRIPLIKLAWDMIKDNPLFGIGANNFATVAKDYVLPDPAWREWFYTVHNKYLLVWAETGIGGLLAFIGFLVVTIRRLWKCWKRHDHLLSPLALGFMAGILGMMAHMLVEVYRGRPVIQALFLIAGLATVMHTVMHTSATPTEYARSSTEG
jgi:putative inorganic carbon (hco3(-)) transporter